MKLIVGTRGSQLALTQTNWVINQLLSIHPEWSIEIRIIRTKGDDIQHVSLDKIGDKGLFVAQLEEALINGEIDFAVHSMKDMPSELTPGLKFASVLSREDARDVLIQRESELPLNPVIGTGSKRRKHQVLSLYPGASVKDIRGNVDTRLKKLYAGDYDAILLAAAGLNRLGIQPQFMRVFECDELLPAPAQGVLAVQIRVDDTILSGAFSTLECAKTKVQVLAERSFLGGLEGSCHKPIGAYAQVDGERLKLTGLFGDEAGQHIVKDAIMGESGQAEALGKQLAKTILAHLNTLKEGSDAK